MTLRNKKEILPYILWFNLFIGFYNLNSIEDLADDVLEILALCGLKYYGKIKSRGSGNEISDS